MTRPALAFCAALALAAVCAQTRTRRAVREAAAWRARAEEAEGALRLLVGANTPAEAEVKHKRKGKRA